MEPFPPLIAAAETTSNRPPHRRRRKSSALGCEIPSGDTGAPALATGLLHGSRSSHDQTPELGRDPSMEETSPKRRRKGRSSLARRTARFVVRHTWSLPLAVLCIFAFLYSLDPTESNAVHHFIFLSYRIEPTAVGEPAQYAKGRKDLCFVFFYTIFLSFTREFVMQEILRPMARRAGITSRGKQARFMEQAYTAVYFAFLGPFGLYVMNRGPVWYFNTRGMYEGFPHQTHEGLFKFYYLFQAAYWAQQAIVLVLGMEKPRKDFKELVGHHIVTLALIGLSYRFHFMYIGIAVYITHDISDLFLATSKVLNYLDSSITVPFYASFICAWIYLRHYLNLRIIYSLFTEFKTVGPYELDWDAEQYKCSLSFAITSTLLVALQALNIVWLYYILRVAYRITMYNEQRDARSDNEGSDNTEIEDLSLRLEEPTSSISIRRVTIYHATRTYKG